MAAGVQRLLVGVSFLFVLATTEPLMAQYGAYNTIQPVPQVFQQAAYPLTMPFRNLIELTQWHDADAGCGLGGCGDAACARPGCARPCCPVGPEGRLWGRADYLLWWTPGARVPALVTTGSLADPVPDTQVLFGDRAYNDEARHQYRFQFGYWLGDCRRWAIQSDWLDLGHNSTEFSASSPGDPILARPFFDVLRGVPAVEIVAYPNWAAGSVHARVTDSFHSAGVTLRRNLLCKTACGTCDGTGCAGDGCLVGLSGGRLDLMGGYRHYQLRDTVTITEQITLTQGGGGQQAGTQFNVHDSFRSRNEFHGGEIGLIAQRFRGRWSFEGMAKLAMGNNRQSVTIDGQTVIRVPDQAPVSHIGGLLALEGTNIGTYQRNSFALIPHFNLELGYQLTKRSRVYVGYDFLLWTSVKRAGDHIDTRVNTAYMPPQVGPLAPPALPAFAWRSADFWAQGVNLGCEVRF